MQIMNGNDLGGYDFGDPKSGTYARALEQRVIQHQADEEQADA